MGFKVIKRGDEPTTIPCNVCDGEFDREEYINTNTGICKKCLSKRTSEQVKEVFVIVNSIRLSREKRNLPFDWFDVRYIILKVWTEQITPNFYDNMMTDDSTAFEDYVEINVGLVSIFIFVGLFLHLSEHKNHITCQNIIANINFSVYIASVFSYILRLFKTFLPFSSEFLIFPMKFAYSCPLRQEFQRVPKSCY